MSATIIVEDGTGKTDSNSYVSEADLTTYATDRGITIAGTEADLIIQAMDYLESKNFIGDKSTKEQALQWPRTNAAVDGWYIDTDEIPQLLIDAECEIAISIDGGTNPLTNQDRSTKREKVGDIEVEYMDGARNAEYLTAAETKLKKLVKSHAGSIRV